MNNLPPDPLPLPEQLLSPAESAQVDQTLLPSRDRFAIRVAVYALRCLRAIAGDIDQKIATLTPEKIAEQVHQQPNMQAEAEFSAWYIGILCSSLRPLREMAQEFETEIEHLTLAQIIGWFEKAVKARSTQ
jgi:hypothetical protein